MDQAWALGRQRVAPPPSARPFDGDPRFAVVTVNYSTTRYLKLMLLTLSEQTALDRVKHVVIVDNASLDGGGEFVRALAKRARRVAVVENRVLLSHARGMRRGLRHLDALDASEPAAERANLIVSVDPDVIFRSPQTLTAVARPFVEQGVAAAGELRRGLYPYPEAQASFLVVRRDCYSRRDVAPWVNHGAPAYWLQRSLWKAGLNVADFPSNSAGYLLHRGRAGVAAAAEHRPLSSYASADYRNPHFMGVPNGAEIWAATEAKWSGLLEREAEPELLDFLAERFA